MTITERFFNHKLVNHNGGHIELPPWCGLTGGETPNLSIPDVYTSSAAQAYPIETVYRDFGRTFVYGKWDSTLNSTRSAGYPCVTTATYKDLANSGLVHSSTVEGGEVGDYELTINYAASCAAHKYAGGYIGAKGGSYWSCRILDNDVQDASNYVKLYVDRALTTAVATTDDYVLMENPYAVMDWYVTADSQPYIGVTMSTMVASYYAWIQTWGVHMIGSTFNSFEGGDGNQFGVFIYHGSFQMLPDNTSGAVHGSIIQVGGAPLAGYLAAGSSPASPADVTIAPPIYLMIRP